MIEFMISLILILALIFVIRVDFTINENKKHPIKMIYFLIIVGRIIQFVILFYIMIWMYQITYFLFHNGHLPAISWLKTEEVSTFVDWGVPILILFGIVNNVIIIGIFEFLVLLLSGFKREIRFDDVAVRRLMMISHLFIVKIFVLIIMHYLETGVLYLDFEYLLTYGLVVVLIKILTQVKLIQEDSDLSI